MKVDYSPCIDCKRAIAGTAECFSCEHKDLEQHVGRLIVERDQARLDAWKLAAFAQHYRLGEEMMAVISRALAYSLDGLKVEP